MESIAPAPEQTEADDTNAEEVHGGPVKSFLEHLEDLRWVIIKAGIALVVGMIVCIASANYLIEVMKIPLVTSGIQEEVKIQSLGPLSGFMVVLNLSFWGGAALAFPLILYFIGDFVVPALKPDEKRYLGYGFGIGAGLFVVGAAFAFFWILPASLKAFVIFAKWAGLPATIWDAKEYFPFVSKLILGVGASFELPVVVLTMVRLGIVDHVMLAKARKYMVVGNLVLAAFITPQDLVSTIMMAAPLQVLYEICIWIARYWARGKVPAEKVDQ